MSKQNRFKEEDFTLKLAVVDTIPVALFLFSMIIICCRFQSLLFAIGASFSLIAGFSKVVWKFLMGLKRGNVKWISNLFIPFQCIGFTCMIAALFLDLDRIHFPELLSAVTSFPAGLFFLIGIGGMCSMIIMSFHFDQSIRSHWKAQAANIIAQAFILTGLLFS